MANRETIETERDRILEELRRIRGRDARLRYLISAGRSAPALSDTLRSDAHLVEGCTAAAWMVCEAGNDGSYHIAMDSEAVIVKGVLSLLQRLYNRRRPEEIRRVPPSFLSEVGILDTISASRRNGISHICQRLVSLGEPDR